MLAAPHQDVAEIERDGGVADTDLARAGRGQRNVAPPHLFRPTVLADLPGFHFVSSARK
jgi:hypothetical protein